MNELIIQNAGKLTTIGEEVCEWEQRLYGIRSDPRLDEYLFPGCHNLSREPVLVHRSLQEAHNLFIGGTGAGKTSLGLLPLLIQLIRQTSISTETLTRSFYAAVVVLDCKGDMALFETVRIEAERAGRKFRF